MEFSEEELRNMSPGQISDLQKKNCIFCHIVSGRVATKKIYEDDKCLAILDINPANPGHVLLLPKEHYSIMPLVPEDLIAHLFTVSKHISQAQLRALRAQGTTIMAANGMVAGQRAPHFMIHIIPRKEGDGVGFGFQTKQLAEEDLLMLASAIRKKVDALMGLDSKEPLDLTARPAKIKSEIVNAEFEEEEPPEPSAAKRRATSSIPKDAPAKKQVADQSEQSEEIEEKPKPSLPARAKPKPKAESSKAGKPAAPNTTKASKPSRSSKSSKDKKEEPANPDLDLISRLF